MKKFFLIIDVILMSFTSFAQQNSNIKIGGYKYPYEFKLNSPSIEYHFIIEKRSDADIKINGGNDYKIYSENNTIPLYVIKRDVWGFFDGDSLYINAYKYTGYDWYAKADLVGKYLYFKATPPHKKKIQKQIGFDPESNTDGLILLGGVAGGLVGGVIVGAVAETVEKTKNGTKRIPILLNVETGDAIFLTKEKLYQIISQYSDLKDEYFAETEIDNEIVTLKYIQKLNEKEQAFSLSPEDTKDQLESKLDNQLKELKNNLYKMDTAISYQSYYEKIIGLAKHPDIVEIKVVEENYSNGNLKSVGLIAKYVNPVVGDDVYSNRDWFYKIGTWRYFYKDGQIKICANYDLIENKEGEYILYDQTGQIKKQEEYKSGKKVK
ncbi:MAG TPA: hypothetical protein DCG75_03800 [Bacteroidales bacterium]|jgi:hypothetical protein|nr:hypothetical protein [Bacteroidales bacterium]